MSFDVKVTHDEACARVRIEGSAGVGRLLSLLKVLEVDCRSWTAPAVLLDLRAVEPPVDEAAQVEIAEAAARALAPLRKIALLVPPGTGREAAGVRVFHDEAAAREWLGRS